MKIDSNNTESIDAFFIKKLRNDNGDSADKLCDEIGVNKTSLYYAENCIRRLSEDMLNRILAHYKVNYNRDMKLYKEAYELTINLYESYLFKDMDSLKKYETEFYEKQDLFSSSRAFIFNDLMLAIINLLKDRTVTCLLLDDIKKYRVLYDNNIECIYAIVYAWGKDVYANLRDVKKVVLEIYKYNSNYNLKPSIEGMLDFQIAKIKRCNHEYFEALKFYEKAIVSLQEIYCIERINQTKIEIAGLLIDLELYDKAEEEYLKCLNEAIKYKYNRRICACLNNLAYLYFIERRYDECIEYVRKAKAARSTHPDINYFLAYCIYQTKSKEEARNIVTKLLTDEKDRYTYRMLKMIQGFINDNHKNIDMYFERSKNHLEKLHDKLEIKVLYEMNIMYNKSKDQDRYLKLVDEYFALIERKPHK